MALWIVLTTTALGGGTFPTPTPSGDTGTLETGESTGETADTGDLTPPPDEDFCVACETAAERANEEGGSPCGSGCTSAPATPLLAVPLLGLIGLRRRR